MISIAMATYNGEKYLREQINSISKQTIQDFELIVCDDCSTDDTWNILLEYQSQDERIKCYRNEKNLGFVKNFEKAIGLCTGEYIALSDQDDIWLPEHLELLVNNIGDKALIAGNGEFFNSTGEQSLGRFFVTEDKLGYISNKPIDHLVTLCHRNLFQGSNTLFKKDLVEYILPIPEGIRFHDHWIPFVAATRNGVFFLPKKTLNYRRYSEAVTYKSDKSAIFVIFDKKFRNKKKKDRDARVLLLKAILEKNPNNNLVYKILQPAVKYYERLYSPAELLNLFYYMVNFKKMYLSRSIVLFTKELIKLLLCC